MGQSRFFGKYVPAAALACVLLGPALPAGAAAGEDAATAPESDLVLLPGQGEVKREVRTRVPHKRLAPGGGLLLSFDGNGDGSVTDAELETGLSAAFSTADDNGDGALTVFEQLDWAADLPTRDDSLSNPVRFDPNLDRQVSYAEFSSVIRNLARPYRSEIDGTIDLSLLKRAPEGSEGETQFPNPLARPDRPQDPRRTPDRRRQP